MSTLSKAMAAMVLASLPSIVRASETTTYTYDAKGRLVQVIKSGGTNGGTTTTYTLDKADNRTQVTTTGVPH